MMLGPSRGILAAMQWFPNRLFAGGEDGAWFDPSDIATLWTDTGGSTAADIDDAVARADDKSGNDVNATQATAAARPILGRVPATGRRNLLEETETLVSGTWLVSEATTAPEGGGVASITPSTSNAQHFALHQNFTTWADNGDFTYSIEMKGTDTGVFGFAFLNGRTKDTQFPGVYINLANGETTEAGAVSTTVTDMGDGWYRITLTANAGTGASAPQFTVSPSTGTTFPSRTFPSDGSAALLVRKPQAEVGTVATDYQRVGSSYDVTEDGVRSLSYLFDDGVDDVLNATLPDLGSDATVAYASDQGVTIQTGQTIGAGAFDVLRDDMLFGMVVIDRALTTAETARLTTWLNHKAGDYA